MVCTDRHLILLHEGWGEEQWVVLARIHGSKKDSAVCLPIHETESESGMGGRRISGGERTSPVVQVRDRLRACDLLIARLSRPWGISPFRETGTLTAGRGQTTIRIGDSPRTRIVILKCHGTLTSIVGQTTPHLRLRRRT